MRRYKKSKSRGKRKMTIPVAPAAAIWATLNPAIMKAVGGDLSGAGQAVFDSYVGANKIPTYTALAVGFGMHILASRFGANRVIANMGIPVFRI